MNTKPIYRVPLMKEIEEIPWNGFNVVSTFSGTGGSCLGYRMAGYRVLWANEFIPAAQDSYKANHPNSILDRRDIREISAQDILTATGLKIGEIDIFDGSPPCAAFSTAGKREAGWGKVKQYSDTKQRVDDLFFEYARLIKGTQPKVFVAENVSGLIKGTAKGYFLEILKTLKDCGYNVKCKVLDAQWLGVPQMRQRTIFVGVREDMGLDPVHPKPIEYRYSVKDALPWVDRCIIGNQDFESIWGDSIVPNPTIMASGATKQSGVCEVDGIKRKYTIPELRRICAFPDDFILAGTYAQQWERLGRAVPPVMMSHIAKTIQLEILEKCVD
jgi:DNA (cytosine-5)-methyltransferase 1